MGEESSAESSRVVLRLRIEEGDPPSGVVTRVDDETGTRFSGWVELMAAITALRVAPDGRRSS